MTNIIERIPSFADEINMSTKPKRDFLLSGKDMVSIFNEGGGNDDITASSKAIAEFKAQGIEVMSTGMKDPIADAFQNQAEG